MQAPAPSLPTVTSSAALMTSTCQVLVLGGPCLQHAAPLPMLTSVDSRADQSQAIHTSASTYTHLANCHELAVCLWHCHAQ